LLGDLGADDAAAAAAARAAFEGRPGLRMAGEAEITAAALLAAAGAADRCCLPVAGVDGGVRVDEVED